MSRLPEITDLFVRLATNFENLDLTATNEDQEATDLSISHLNQSLNLEDSSRVRVLDTALSLMCFRTPQVFDSVIEYLVKTIVAVLSSLHVKHFGDIYSAFKLVLACEDSVPQPPGQTLGIVLLLSS
ncbi:hypothetical protein Acr_00g0084810 [Actinidia rufa]|uniref:Uncharacterized protein n=1 Tax=Actinidia rufa TaxID=165716 RepID=A0A7J0DWH0_9ERIC|nr:hypothetical protein Acr_00g0084810 [Actinidia rufa]